MTNIHAIRKYLITAIMIGLICAGVLGCLEEDDDGDIIGGGGGDTDTDTDSDTDAGSDSGSDTDADTDSDTDVDTDTDADADADSGDAPPGESGFWGYVSYPDGEEDESVADIGVCVSSGDTDYGCVKTDEEGLYIFDGLPAFPKGCNIQANGPCSPGGACWAGTVWDVQTGEDEWLRVDVELELQEGK